MIRGFFRLVGLLLLAFQLFGRGVAFGGTGSITLVDQDYQGNRIELSAAASDVEIRPGSGSRIPPRSRKPCKRLSDALPMSPSN
jgi:hypothetical protein